MRERVPPLPKEREEERGSTRNAGREENDAEEIQKTGGRRK